MEPGERGAAREKNRGSEECLQRLLLQGGGAGARNQPALLLRGFAVNEQGFM